MLLEYERKTRFPTRRGNLRFRVDSDGAVYLQRNDTEPPPGQEWTQPYPAEPLRRLDNPERRLRRLLDRHGFFTMPPHTEDPASTDGIIERLSYHGEGGPRTVTVDRARIKAFRVLVRQLAELLGVSDSL